LSFRAVEPFLNSERYTTHFNLLFAFV